MVLLDRANYPMPERQRFRVGIVDAENMYTFVDPETEDVAELLPELRPGVGLEMKRIDVLVLLRRIFGVLNCSVRPRLKPILVLGDVRMIGRRLKRDIERQLDSAVTRRGDQMLEIVHRPELRID